MQLIEVSMAGVRSAVITLRAPGTPMRIILFPMIHAGTPGFYRSVTARLAGCDLIVAEGISGRSVVVQALTLAYRLPARSRRLALAVQDIDYSSLGVPVIRPDLTAGQFRARWRTVPVLQRLAVLGLVPAFALAFGLLGARRAQPLPGHRRPADVLGRPGRQVAPQLTELILTHRDALLLDSLTTIHQQRQAETIDVAVVYGAGHMPALTHELYRRHAYRPSSAEWLTVFDF
jgi:hypothetical protein